MLSLIVSIIIVALVIGLLWWIVTLIPLPPPFAQVIQVVIALIAVLWLIHILLGLEPAGHVVL